MRLFENFQKNLNSLMEQKGWGDTDLAPRVGMKPPQVNRYKKGRAEPGLEQIGKFCEAFQIPVSALLGKDLPALGRVPLDFQDRLDAMKLLIDADLDTLKVVIDELRRSSRGSAAPSKKAKPTAG